MTSPRSPLRSEKRESHTTHVVSRTRREGKQRTRTCRQLTILDNKIGMSASSCEPLHLTDGAIRLVMLPVHQGEGRTRALPRRSHSPARICDAQRMSPWSAFLSGFQQWETWVRRAGLLFAADRGSGFALCDVRWPVPAGLRRPARQPLHFPNITFQRRDHYMSHTWPLGTTPTPNSVAANASTTSSVSRNAASLRAI